MSNFVGCFFVSENFCRLFSKPSLVMFWSGHSHRPSNSDVNQYNICKNTAIHFFGVGTNINKFCVYVRVIVSESSVNKHFR